MGRLKPEAQEHYLGKIRNAKRGRERPCWTTVHAHPHRIHMDTVAHSADLHPAQMRYDVTSRDVPDCLASVTLAHGMPGMPRADSAARGTQQ